MSRFPPNIHFHSLSQHNPVYNLNIIGKCAEFGCRWKSASRSNANHSIYRIFTAVLEINKKQCEWITDGPTDDIENTYPHTTVEWPTIERVYKLILNKTYHLSSDHDKQILKKNKINNYNNLSDKVWSDEIFVGQNVSVNKIFVT